jgi:hypothetical protein
MGRNGVEVRPKTFGEPAVEGFEIYSTDESGILNKSLKFRSLHECGGLVPVFRVTTSLDRAVLNPDASYT